MPLSNKKYPSIYPGTVTDNKDPDGLGRVRALCPHIDDKTATVWAWPIGMPMAGKAQRGLFAPPEKNSQVVVMFVEGDRRYPLYLPGWHGRPDDVTEVPTSSQGQEAKTPDSKSFETKRWEIRINDGTPGLLQVKDKNTSTIFKIQDDGVVVIEAVGIELGAAATEAVLKGDKFKTIYDAHTHPETGGTTGAPVVPLPADNLSTDTKVGG